MREYFYKVIKSRAFLSLTFTITSFALTNQLNAYTRFQYQLDGKVKNYRVHWVFLDLFDNSSSTIKAFRKQGKKVICYFSAGTYENWRSDKGRFPSSIRGKSVDGWAGEQWLDTSSSTTLSIMKSRLDLARSKGCTGVDPDNVDGFDNNTGFNLSKSTSINYLKRLASEAHSRGLWIGLKNSAEIASSLSSTMNFAVVEECFKYNECGSYSSFVSKRKPVFLIEYSSGSRSMCNQADSRRMNLAFFNLDLNGKFKVCH
ncbi:MAG: endo alpha-1,4 polygalactosaminidase [Bdellovibrionota bacterium]